MIKPRDLNRWFRYHAPRPDQVRKYGQLRDQALALANLILEVTPPSEDQEAAIQLIRQAVLLASAAIAGEVG
jgi:hypothetical protein